jgi:MEDS: MEthanogen/methylotroph, DcmR Sensory domain
MVTGMCSTLAAMGVDVASEVASSRIILSSATASAFAEFNGDLMIAKIERFVNEALEDGYKGLWASGDMSFEFGPRKDFSQLLDYELKLEKLIYRRKELCGVCQYHCDTLPQDALRHGLLVHPTIVINETLTMINPHYLESFCPTDRSTSNRLDEMITTICRP